SPSGGERMSTKTTPDHARRAAGPRVSEAEARAVAEAARETEWTRPSFVRELFLGKLRLDLIDPNPPPDPREQARGRAFLEEFGRFLTEEVDAEAIEADGRLPEDVIEGLHRLGAFGIKIPREYGGLGLSQRTYVRAMALASSVSSAIAVLLSAHQSIG